LSVCIAHRRVRRTPLMRFSSLTRAVDCTAAACSLQTQAGASAGQAAQSAVQRSPPSVTHITGYYSFHRPRRDGRLSWPCWLTDSRRRTHKVVKQPSIRLAPDKKNTHKVVKQPSISLAQDKESPPAGTDVLTTMLRHQLATEGRSGWVSLCVCLVFSKSQCSACRMWWISSSQRLVRAPGLCTPLWAVQDSFLRMSGTSHQSRRTTSSTAHIPSDTDVSHLFVRIICILITSPVAVAFTLMESQILSEHSLKILYYKATWGHIEFDQVILRNVIEIIATRGAFRTFFSLRISENLRHSNLEALFALSTSVRFSEKSWARFSFATLC